jgi:hypothetical protein
MAMTVTITSKKHQIFVIQPLDKSAEGIYDLIRAAASAANAVVARADSVVSAGSDIISSIESAIQAASILSQTVQVCER